MDSVLHKCLETVEAAGLPEGEYLKACNALKKAFQEKDGEYKTARLLFAMKMESDEMGSATIRAVSAEYKKRSNFLWETLSVNLEITIKDTTTHQIRIDDARDLIKSVLFTLRPTVIAFETGFGRITVDAEDTLKSLWDEYKMCKEITDEYDDDYGSNFDLDNFFAWAAARAADFIIRESHTMAR